MAEASALKSLLARASADPDPRERDRAYEELARLLLVLVRARLGDRLREKRESMDVCQSLARSFVEDLTTGKIVFESEGALVAYLRKAVGSKLADLARMDNAERRGGGVRTTPLDASGASMSPALADDAPGASAIVGANEQQAMILAQLDDDERRLVALRRSGLEWPQIARELGASEESLRKRWSRLQQRIAAELEDA